MSESLEEKFSYSKIDCYSQCPFKFKLVYRDGHYVKLDTIATLFGTALHKAEEDIAKCIMAGQAVDYQTIKAEFAEETTRIKELFPKEFETPDKSKKTYSEKTQGYLNSGIYRLENFVTKYPKIKIMGAEIPFEVEYTNELCPENGYKLHGFIDRAFYDPESDTYLVQDIKTYSKALTKDKLKTPLQFVVYTLAAEKLFNTTRDRVYCQYDLPLLNKVQQITEPNFVAQGLQLLNKQLAAIDKKDFMPNPSALCAWCNFSKTNPEATDEVKYLCPYHSVWDRETRNRFQITKSEVTWMGLENNDKITEAYVKKHQK